MAPLFIGLVSILALLGLAITAWVFWPAFQGPEVARRALGTHRLAIGSIVAVLVLNAVIVLMLSPWVHLDQGLNTGKFVLLALSTEIPMLLIVYVRLILPGAVTWQELGLRRLGLEYTLRMGLGCGLLGLVIIDLVIGTLLSEIGLRPNQLDQFQFVLSEGPFAFALLVFTAGVLAPFVEELFFRGFLFGLYRRRQPLWVAYAVSSLVFTALHLQPNSMNLSQMAGLSVGILLLAIMLAWLYERTGSLYPGMLAHAVNNITGLLLFYVVGLR